ncbi:MAG: DUF2336 domain-containing protein [Rhodospirillales bacterium]|nr:DUF2336 domain-containing protein [Rhodospirillales bacterium]MBO6786430.1 DUF2336 domain-containing protein [Rhodospirillales bacterium]
MTDGEERKFDAEFLMSLARQKSAASRSELTNIIIDLFDNQSSVLSERQRAQMYGILETIINDIEVSVRQAVAGRLALMDDVPRNLVSRLANDEINVAFPILSKSGLLRDENLIEVIKLRTEEHMLAITMRKFVSESVSDAIVETGREPVIISLLKNTNARISTNTMEYLVEQSRRVDSFQEPILNRDELDPELAKKMFLWVSAALRQHIVDHFSLDRATVDELLEQATAEEIAASGRGQKKKVKELADALRDEGLVTVEMLTTALREGEVPLFIALFAQVSKLREHLIQRLVFEQGGEGLAIACRGIGMSENEFIELYEYCHLAKAGTKAEVEAQTPSLRAFYSNTPRKAAVDVLKMWHRGSDYLGALRELETRLKDHG